MLRPLTKANVEKHLGVLGLEAEFATHAHMRGLSGGQKVKVVLAACTWNQPHILVMDEPTNYLDRDSLGALAGAIKEFGGGVVIISHHNEFTRSATAHKLYCLHLLLLLMKVYAAEHFIQAVLVLLASSQGCLLYCADD